MPHRSQHSIRKGFSLDAKYASRSKSRVAPRLSELETNMYLIPSAKSFENKTRRNTLIRHEYTHHFERISKPSTVGKSSVLETLARLMGSQESIGPRIGAVYKK